MSINISEVIWTVICFFALFFVLKKLLFDPILRFMDERQARIDAAAAESRRVKEQTAAAQTAAEEQLRRQSAIDAELLSRSKAENARARADALQKAHREAAQTLSAARQRIAGEESEAHAAVNAAGDALARELAEHLLTDTESE